jgi:hypothetical protein
MDSHKGLLRGIAHSRKGQQVKLINILGQTNRSFASVFLAFGLFGFLSPHQTKQVQQNHRVNLMTTEQGKQPEPADDGSQYEWFY